MQIETRYRVTDHYLKDLIELIRRESYDFVLLGGGPEFINDYVAPRRSSLLLADELNRIRRQIRKKMYFPGESTRDTARRLFANVSCSVGVFVNRNFRGADRIGVLMLDERDRALLDEIAMYLLSKETITGDEFMAYVNADSKRLTDGSEAEEPPAQTEAPSESE